MDILSKNPYKVKSEIENRKINQFTKKLLESTTSNKNKNKNKNKKKNINGNGNGNGKRATTFANGK